MRLTGPGPQDVVLELPRDRVGDACAIAWSQPSDGALWRLDVDVVTRAGRRRLGYVSPLPRGASRIVAIASCPGAERWIVTAHGPPGAKGELELAAAPPTEALAPGVVALDEAGRALPYSAPRTYRPAALTGGPEIVATGPARLVRVRGAMGSSAGYVQVWALPGAPAPGDVPVRVLGAGVGESFELVDGAIYDAVTVTVSSTPATHTAGPQAWIEVDYE